MRFCGLFSFGFLCHRCPHCIGIALSEIPLAPQKVLTQFGLQGITARDGIIAFLTQGGYQSSGDYALAVYVMMSRARQLDDVFIVDLPKREIFEGFLQAHNPTLVRRMQELEDMSHASEVVAENIARSVGWSL